MLKKIRRRMIASAMLAFFAVILLIGVLVNLLNYYVVTGRVDQTLSCLPDSGGTFPGRSEPGAPPPPAFPDTEDTYMIRFFTVSFDADGRAKSVFTDYIATVDGDEAVSFAEQALKKHGERGYIGEYRYAVRKSGDGTVVAFLNTARERQFIISLRLLTLAVASAALAAAFVLVYLLSGRAIRPIVVNIEKQKQFITDAGHELKTPLTSISASIDVISMEQGESEWTDNIRKQVGRMSALVGKLVTLSRLDEEKPFPDKENFSLSNAAWELAEVYAPQAKAHDKKLDIDIRDGISMLGEKAAVQQMLSVLLDNAIRYSDEGGEIRLSLSKKKNRTVIEVFNTCRLDSPPDTERLFDRFYRPDGSRNPETGGTGIGLAIAKAVVETHGGTISADCPDGKSMTIRAVF